MLLFIESIIAYHEDRISMKKEDLIIYGFENINIFIYGEFTFNQSKMIYKIFNDYYQIVMRF